MRGNTWKVEDSNSFRQKLNQLTLQECALTTRQMQKSTIAFLKATTPLSHS